MSTRSRRILAHVLLIAVVLVWGATFPLVKSALHDVSPLLFNLLRMALAALVLLAINPSTLRNLTRTELLLSAAAGLFLALGYSFQTTGLARTTPSKSAFLTGLVVVLVPLLSLLPHVAARGTPKPGLSAFLGALLAFAGIILLTSTPASPSSSLAGVAAGTGLALLSGMHLGEWLSLLCAVAFAAHLLTLARAAPQVSARRLGTLQIAFAALIMLLTLPLDGHPTLHLTLRVLIALGVTALFATAAAFTIQSWAQQLLPPTHTALILTLEPVFAALTSLLFLHERFGARELFGAALILAGILLAELLPGRAQAAIPPA
jgi:drug/metabolite transporter (DMT)-like permease